jgi:hypothetical protein
MSLRGSRSGDGDSVGQSSLKHNYMEWETQAVKSEKAVNPLSVLGTNRYTAEAVPFSQVYVDGDKPHGTDALPTEQRGSPGIVVHKEVHQLRSDTR